MSTKFRKALSFVLVLITIMCLVPSYQMANADTAKVEKTDELSPDKISAEGEILYLTEKTVSTMLEEAHAAERVFAVDAQSLNEARINSASFFISDYQEISSDSALLGKAKEIIYAGKIIYIRAKESEVDITDLYQLFGCEEMIQFVTSDDAELLAKQQKQTYGYLVYFGSVGSPQVVRQELVFVSGQDDQLVKEQKQSKTDQYSEEKRDYNDEIVLGFDEELYAAQVSVNDISECILLKASNETKNDFSLPSDFHYYSCIDCYTMYDDTNGDKVGSVSVFIWAKRIVPVTQKLGNGRLSPNITASDIIPGVYEPFWTFLIDMRMTPNRDKKMENKKAVISAATYPNIYNNKTYKEKIFDFAPRQATDGNHQVTLTLGISAGYSGGGTGVGSFGVSWAVDNRDITVGISANGTGGNSENKVNWTYTMKRKNVKQNTIDLIPGVLVVNQNNTDHYPNAGLCVSVIPTFYKPRTSLGSGGKPKTYTIVMICPTVYLPLNYR